MTRRHLGKSFINHANTKQRKYEIGPVNKANTKVDENSHTIYINSTAVFGGVEIK